MGRSLKQEPPPTYRRLSLWHESTPDDWRPRPPLPGDRSYDVAVVGGGLTGLWTAYYLNRADPSLRIVVIDKHTVGFGASGRNGGWCSSLFPVSLATLARLPGSNPSAAVAQHRAMKETVDEVGRVLDFEGIDAHFTKGGTISLARNLAQLAGARANVRHAREWGDTTEDLALLDATESDTIVHGSRTLAATYTPHCAAVHPARLVRGLASVVERDGVVIHESTTAISVQPGRVVTDHGIISAERVIRATEGYTAGLTGHRRVMVPVYSLVVATEPLTDATWEQIGLEGRATFTDYRNLVIYGQRTADGRLVFGGRGAPYHFGSRTLPGFDHDHRVFAALRATLIDLFPVLARTRFTHAWGGALGIPRDWCASVGLDQRTGLGWAGGYVGDGLSTTNLAGRTLRDLLLGQDTELSRLPWVNHRSPSWEPEPLRWTGINTGLRLIGLADVEERCTGRPSTIAKAISPLLGGH